MATITVVGANANPPKVHTTATDVRVTGLGFTPGLKANLVVKTGGKTLIGPVLIDIDGGGGFFLHTTIKRVSDGTQLEATAEEYAVAIAASGSGEVRSEL